jgi:hypothetical protein
MDILDKLDLMIDTTVAGDVATNTAKGSIDVIGGECPKGTVYDKIKKICVPVKNEASKAELYKLYSKALNAIPNSPKQLKIRKEIEKLRKELGEASIVGGAYIGGNSNIAGSGQTRIWGIDKRNILDLARKEPVEIDMDDPTDTNIIGRKGLRFNKLTGAYTPSIWGEDG